LYHCTSLQIEKRLTGIRRRNFKEIGAHMIMKKRETKFVRRQSEEARTEWPECLWEGNGSAILTVRSRTEHWKIAGTR